MKSARRFLSFLAKAASITHVGVHARHARAYARLLRASWRLKLVLAVNDSGLVRSIGAINESIGTADWIRVSPFGEWPNEVGLQVFDRAGSDMMVTAFNSAAEQAANLWRGLPIYEGHPDNPVWMKANPGYRRVAVGRVKELQTRADGLWARTAFNEKGNPLVRGDAPAYEAQSPHWGMRPITHRGRPAMHPELLHSLGLTNTPNIPGTQLGLNEQPDTISVMNKQYIIALLAALGRPVANPAAVTDEQLSAAINEAVPVATAAITASNEIGTVRTKLTTTEGELATMKPKLTSAETALQTAINEAATLRSQVAQARTAQAEAVLVVAINEGRITQAQHANWLGKFTAVNADFAKVEGELKALKKAVNTTSRVAGLGTRKAEVAADNGKVSAINEAIAEVKAKQPNLSHFDAFNEAKRQKPALFSVAAE